MKKVTITLNPKQEERLRDVSATLGATQAEVIRRAIAMFHKIVTDSANNTVQVVDEHGKVKEIVVT